MALTPPLAALSSPEDHLVVRWHEPGVAEVILSNPAQRNAMSAVMTRSWELVMRELAGMDELRAVLVRADGPAFCAGGDLGWLAEGGDHTVAELSDRMDRFYAAWLSVTGLQVPTVAHISGPAVGAGAAVALACDIRWVGDGARFSVPFTRLGLHAGMGTTYLLPQAVGAAMARDLLLTGRTLGAAEMLDCGLATALVQPDEVLQRVRELAGNAPVALRLTKRGLRAAPRTLDEALVWEGVAQPVTMTTRDVQEGLEAAKRRRRPRFTGS
jgi:enoyl-CoA hydratase